MDSIVWKSNKKLGDEDRLTKFRLITHRSKIIASSSSSSSSSSIDDDDDDDDLKLILPLCIPPDLKTVFRCKLVCKKWYRIISSGCFVRSFLNYHQHFPNITKISHFVPQFPKMHLFPPFLHKIHQIKECLAISKDNHRNNIVHDVVDNDDDHNISVIASFNDLLLCQLGQSGYYCICNPLTREYVILPRTPNRIINHLKKTIIVGFVCDSDYLTLNHKTNKNGDVVVDHVTVNPRYNYTILFMYTPLHWISERATLRQFSSLTNQWHDSIIDVPLPKHYSLMYTDYACVVPMTFVQGMWFWLNSCSSKLCIYNPQSATLLNPIQLPPGQDGTLGMHVLGVCQGFLRFFHLTKSYTENDIFVHVWELKDFNSGRENWSLKHQLPLYLLGNLWKPYVTQQYTEGDYHKRYNLSALAVDSNDTDIVYIELGDHREILSCNIGKREMKQFQPGPFVRRYCQVFPVMTPPWPTPIRLRQLSE
ncbi:hypothetical protein ACFE04_030216 [Oxalis oulophora]